MSALDAKWIEIIILAASNVISLALVVGAKCIVTALQRQEEREVSQRKYSMSHRRMSTHSTTPDLALLN